MRVLGWVAFAMCVSSCAMFFQAFAESALSVPVSEKPAICAAKDEVTTSALRDGDDTRARFILELCK